MDMQLEGKRALVTGGSRGIGKAIARALAQEGVDVALLARSAHALNAAAIELASQTGRKVVGVRGDTTSDDSVRQAVAEAVSALGGRIDILVNAAAEPAGFAGPPKLAEITGSFFHGELDTKVMGYIRCAREVVAGMQSAGWGRIVNVSGLAARQTGNTVGSIRNVAVAALTKNMADEFGPLGINVTVVHPGLTRTERTGPLVAARATAQGVSAKIIEAQMAATNTINHIVDATEVADVVAFLCSRHRGRGRWAAKHSLLIGAMHKPTGSRLRQRRQMASSCQSYYAIHEHRAEGRQPDQAQRSGRTGLRMRLRKNVGRADVQEESGEAAEIQHQRKWRQGECQGGRRAEHRCNGVQNQHDDRTLCCVVMQEHQAHGVEPIAEIVRDDCHGDGEPHGW